MIDKYILGLVITVILGPALTYYLTKKKAENDTAKRFAEAPLDAMQKANGELVSFMREQMDDVKTERDIDHKEREQLVAVLVETRDAIRAFKDEMVEHRKEERERTGAVHERLNKITEKLTLVQGKVGAAGG